jgi:hypothetical protein
LLVMKKKREIGQIEFFIVKVEVYS